MARRSVVGPTAVPLVPGAAAHWCCTGCGHGLIRVHTPDGERVLDTDVETWVLGIVGEAALSTYYRSRSYPVHNTTCGA